MRQPLWQRLLDSAIATLSLRALLRHSLRQARIARNRTFHAGARSAPPSSPST